MGVPIDIIVWKCDGTHVRMTDGRVVADAKLDWTPTWRTSYFWKSLRLWINVHEIDAPTQQTLDDIYIFYTISYIIYW